MLLGAGAVARPDGAAVASAAKKVAKAAGCLAEGWNGYGVLQSAGGAAGALDVGFVPGPTAGPLSALKLVYLLGADEVPFEERSRAPSSYTRATTGTPAHRPPTSSCRARPTPKSMAPPPPQRGAFVGRSAA